MGIGAEVAVFVTRRNGREVLLLHRVPADGSYWHVVAGAVEPAESASEAALRELLEETGFVGRLDESVEVVEFADGATLEPASDATTSESVVSVRITCYRVRVPDEWEPVLDDEHDTHRWCPPREAADTLIWPETARALRILLAT